MIDLARIRRVTCTLLIASLALAGCAPATTSDQLIGRTLLIGVAHPLSEPGAMISSWAAAAGENPRILLNFWASWCTPCRDEIPLLYSYAVSPSPSATVVGVLYQDALGPAAASADKLGATWMHLIDAEGAIALQVPVRAAPLTLLLDASGVVLDYRVGPFSSVAEVTEFAEGP